MKLNIKKPDLIIKNCTIIVDDNQHSILLNNDDMRYEFRNVHIIHEKSLSTEMKALLRK